MKLLLVDGHSLAYRAFYAMPSLSNSKGQSTQAVLAMANMIFKILKEEKPTHLMVFFDRETPKFRLEAYPEYKANRQKPPDDFLSQLPLMKELFSAMDVPVIEEPGYEADDWIATVTKQAQETAGEIAILSGDLDLLQLVNEKTVVLASRRGISQLTRYTLDEIKKRFSLHPSQLVDLKALVGDPSDNIVGVTGLGEKSATKLLQEWGSLENAVNHLSELPPKIRETLGTSAEKIALNRNLVTLRQDAPLGFNPETAQLNPFNREKLRHFLEEMEFSGLIERLGLSESVTLTTPEFTLVDSENLLDEMNGQLKQSSQAGLLLWPAPSPFLNEHFLGIELPDERRFIIPPSHFKKALHQLVSHDSLKEAMVYDWKSFLLAFRAEKLPTPKWLVHDVLITGWLCNSLRTSPSLVDLARENLAIPLPDQPKGSPSPAVLASWTSVLLKLGTTLKVKLQALQLESVYEKIELPLISVLAQMEWSGIAIDLVYLKQLSEELKTDLAKLEQQIYEQAGTVFNINSSKQLAEILYQKLLLPKGRKGKTGYSTDVEELERLAEHSPVALALLQYRELSKLQNTYLDTFPKMVSAQTKRLHTTYIQTGTATGRLSSKDPNLQNIPIRTSYGKKIRKAFRAEKSDWKILSADYSQIELRLLAHVSKDPVLCEAFLNQEDIHARTAGEVFGVSKENITSEMRRMAKVVNFGIIYGMTEHGLAQSLKMKREEAREYIRKYFERFPQVEVYLQQSVLEARNSGTTRTLFGRIRLMPELQSGNSFMRQQAERIAVNAPLQGTAADLIKIAMTRIQEKIEQQKLAATMVLQVHDELVFEVLESDAKQLASMVKEEMENVHPLDIPLVVDLAMGEDWADGAPLLLPQRIGGTST